MQSALELGSSLDESSANELYSTRLRTRAAAIATVALFVGSFLVYLASPARQLGADTRPNVDIAFNIIKHGTTTLDSHRSEVAYADYLVERVRGHTYGYFPIGTPLLMVPAVAALEGPIKVASRFKPLRNVLTSIGTYPNQDRPLDAWKTPNVLEATIAALYMALLVALFLRIVTRALDLKRAVFLAVVFAFCTSVYSTASRATWQPGMAMLVACVAILFFLRAMEHRQQPLSLFLAGLATAYLIVIRPTTLVFVVALSVFALVRWRLKSWSYCAGTAMVAVLFLAYNLVVYHGLQPYYQSSRFQLAAKSWEAAAGSLVSPSRGLFIFSPVLLFAFYGIYLKLKERKLNGLDAALLLYALTIWVSVIGFPIGWWGGYSVGPRLMTETTLVAVWFLVPVVGGLVPTSIGALRKMKIGTKGAFSVFVVCVALSCFINARSAIDERINRWNVCPVEVNNHTERLWDWSQAQWLFIQTCH